MVICSDNNNNMGKEARKSRNKQRAKHAVPRRSQEAAQEPKMK